MSPTVTTPRPAPTRAPQELPAGTSASRARARPAWSFPGDSRTVLAASGFVMLGFVALHLGGNLLAFAGGAAFNAYARGLRELGAPLVGPGVVLNVARIVLAGALVAHLGAHARILLAGDASPTPASRPIGRLR